MPREQDRPRLGRGLSSLIRNSTIEGRDSGVYESVQKLEPPSPAPLPASAATPPGSGETSPGVAILQIEKIEANPSQPRRSFDEASLAQLADSIRTHGMLQPILVSRLTSPDGSARYQLIAGERRLRAARVAGVHELPCIIRPASPEQMVEFALIENIHRSDLNPIERANAYQGLIDRFSMTQQDVADRVGEPRTTVANYLRILDLPNDVRNFILDGSLTFGHAKALAALAGSPGLQTRLADKAVAANLSVRRLEQLVKLAAEGGEGQVKAPAPVRSRPAYLADVERQLSETIGTRVAVRPGRAKHSGRIQIEYYSLEDFDRIVALLGASLQS